MFTIPAIACTRVRVGDVVYTFVGDLPAELVAAALFRGGLPVGDVYGVRWDCGPRGCRGGRIPMCMCPCGRVCADVGRVTHGYVNTPPGERERGYRTRAPTSGELERLRVYR